LDLRSDHRRGLPLLKTGTEGARDLENRDLKKGIGHCRSPFSALITWKTCCIRALGPTGCGRSRCFERARVYSCRKRSKMSKGFSPRGILLVNVAFDFPCPLPPVHNSRFRRSTLRDSGPAP
jgi:hypothetical protein